MERLLSVADASRVLNVTPGAVRLMVRRGELRAAGITEGGIRLFRRAEVERLARRRAAQLAREAAGDGKETI